MGKLAWHFTNGRTLRDGSPIPPDGETLVHDGIVKICSSGLHASRRLIDALKYAPGSEICRVRMEAVVAEQDDKLVAWHRTILWRVSAAEGAILLHDFARRCALDVIHLWDAPDVVREYLETGDESLREEVKAAAMSTIRSTGAAAEYAARSAAYATWTAAQSTGYDTGPAAKSARSAAKSARSAGYTAARSAAQSAVWSAAHKKQNRRLTAMVSTRKPN